jgi:hypothetical protein
LRIRFYFDDDSAERALLEALRMRGVTVCTPIDAGLAGADDADHLAWCAKNEWVLVTHNISDFWALHTDLLAGGNGHSGLVLIRQQTLGIGEKLRRLLRLSAALSAEEMKDRAEFLSNWN